MDVKVVDASAIAAFVRAHQCVRRHVPKTSGCKRRPGSRVRTATKFVHSNRRIGTGVPLGAHDVQRLVRRERRRRVTALHDPINHGTLIRAVACMMVARMRSIAAGSVGFWARSVMAASRDSGKTRVSAATDARKSSIRPRRIGDNLSIVSSRAASSSCKTGRPVASWGAPRDDRDEHHRSPIQTRF
jgi:hypothetical protein